MLRRIFLLSVVLTLVLGGCFSGDYFVPTDSECMHRCGKCGKRVLMLNSLLKNEACPQGGTHHWQYNLNR